MTGASKNAIQGFLAAIGPVYEAYQNRALRNLPCKKIQCDEIWSFCYAKQKNVPADKQGQFGYGDVWTWTALCADTKLICSWKIGTRGASTAYALMHDLEKRLANRIQLTADGHRVYLEAVESAFGAQIDYAMLVKLYGNDRESEARYSPNLCRYALGHIPVCRSKILRKNAGSWYPTAELISCNPRWSPSSSRLAAATRTFCR